MAEADGRYCGVCRALRERAVAAMTRDTDTPSALALEPHIKERIAAEQAKRRAAGLPEGGMAARDSEHARRRRRARLPWRVH